jgi:hypothetical protein
MTAGVVQPWLIAVTVEAPMRALVPHTGAGRRNRRPAFFEGGTDHKLELHHSADGLRLSMFGDERVAKPAARESSRSGNLRLPKT